MKILDCTLRDGGYYTNWAFDSTLVRNMVYSLNENHVDIIELGYKSPIKGGRYKKCNDGYISTMIDSEIKSKLSFMIDAKDFYSSSQINYDLLNICIDHCDKSPFSVCRLAIKSEELDPAKLIAQHLLYKGYELIINLMGVSLLKQLDILSFIEGVKDLATVLYFADSYGNLTPASVKGICKIFKEATNKECGIHCHDNLGLAFANSLQAIDSGFSYVDGTVCGMGRGVGNTRTEQLIITRNNRPTDSLLNLVDNFENIKSKYQWGFNPVYMMAGMSNIHPMFAQDLTQLSLSPKKTLNTINNLANKHTYIKDLVKDMAKQRAVVVIPARYYSSRFPGKPLAKINGKEMILHVAEKASQAVGNENVYIATENEEISKVAQYAGYKVVLTSDSCLTGTDRVAEASLEIEADIFINVQGDEPMIDPNDIIKVIKLKEENPDLVINCMAKLNINENSNDKKIPKVACDKNSNLLYASRNALPGNKNGDSQNVMKQVCIYAFSHKDLASFSQLKKSPLEYQEDIEILRFIENGIPVQMLEVNNVSYAVDYPEDIVYVEKQLNKE